MSDEGESGASITLLLREAMEVEVHARRHRRRNEWAEAARVALACTPADSDLPLSGAASASTARLGVAQFVFDVPWPVSEVLHEGAVRKYNDIFGLVLQVKHAKHQLDEVRSCSRSHHSRRSAVLSPSCRQLHHSLRHERAQIQRIVSQYAPLACCCLPPAACSRCPHLDLVAGQPVPRSGRYCATSSTPCRSSYTRGCTSSMLYMDTSWSRWEAQGERRCRAMLTRAPRWAWLRSSLTLGRSNWSWL